ELHLVDPIPVAVVRPQGRRVLVRQAAALERLGRPGTGAQGADPLLERLRALAPHRLDQRHVRLVDVVALERRSLVEDLAGQVLLDRRHQTGTLLSIGIAEVQKVTSPATRASRRSASRGLRASGPTRDSPIAPTRAAATVSVSCAASSPDSTPSRRTPASTSR